MIIDLLIKMGMLLFIIVYIIDISGVIEEIKKYLFKLIKGKNVEYYGYSLKPFDCSLCMTFWIIIIYLIYNNISIIESIFYGTLYSFISVYFSYAMRKLIGIIYK